MCALCQSSEVINSQNTDNKTLCLTHLCCHQDKTAHVEIIFKGVLSKQLFHILTRSTSTTFLNQMSPSLTTRYSPVLLLRSAWRCKGQLKLKYASLSPAFLKSHLPPLAVMEHWRVKSKSLGRCSTRYWAQLKASEY